MRAVLVDDERIARARLRNLLEAEPDVEIAGECANGREALALLARERCDVLFLDIQMPESDGFSVLRSLPRDRTPLVVFVTAYDHYALQAFEVRAFDYLLKPFDRERFRRTLALLRQELARVRPAGTETHPRWLATEREGSGADRIAIRSRGRVLLVKTDMIDWVEAADNYVCLHCGPATHIMRETLNGLENRLNAAQFLRIHRSSIVNVDRIAELQPWFHGDYRVVLRDGTVLMMSRSYRERVESRLRVAG